jgi:thiol:disulfide interchange protein DsbD
VRAFSNLFIVIFLGLAGNFANAAHTQAQLILSADIARPGDTIWAGVDLKMEPGWHTYWKNPGAAGMATKIQWQLPPGVSAGEIQWPLPEKFPPVEVTTYGYENEVVLLVPLKLANDLRPGQLDLKADVSWLECKEVCIPGRASVQATLNIGTQTKASADAALIQLWQGKMPKSHVSDLVPAGETIWKMLLYAFIGGLILNIMPCVLPVIALKILGFVSEARSEPRHVRKLGLVYALGVLVSFIALAGIVIGIKAAGHRAGWGMQFGSPIFVVCLTTLVMLVALNLFGVFEVSLSGRAMNAADRLASKHGTTGAFFNGVLATALATPCTAPFLSIALGFAFAQNAPVIVLVFLAVGIGLAAPYVVLSWNPAWLKFLPKPGAWMEKFKIVMGFPMLATAVWLFNLAYGDYGKRVLWLGVFLVLVALAAWVFGKFVQRGRTRRGLALAIALILLIGGYAYALENQLNWRAPMTIADTTGSLKNSPNGIDWQRWTPEAVAKARSEGRPMLVDFTADWCLTCQVNKKTSIEIPSVRSKLKEINAITLLGDYTHFPDAITLELNRYNRAGVPLVLVYPKNPDAEPIVLPEILTPGIVLDALNRAAR